MRRKRKSAGLSWTAARRHEYLQRVFTRGSAASCGSRWSADAPLLPVPPNPRGEISSALAPELRLTETNSRFGNILAELLMSDWAEDDASVWTEIEDFPCETFPRRAPVGHELREIYCLSHVSQSWCAVAVVLVYLSMGCIYGLIVGVSSTKVQFCPSRLQQKIIFSCCQMCLFSLLRMSNSEQTCITGEFWHHFHEYFHCGVISTKSHMMYRV